MGEADLAVAPAVRAVQKSVVIIEQPGGLMCFYASWRRGHSKSCGREKQARQGKQIQEEMSRRTGERKELPNKWWAVELEMYARRQSHWVAKCVKVRGE